MVASRVGGKATSFCQSAGRYHRLMGSSTSSAISPPAVRSASSEKKRSRRGEPPPRREAKLGLPNCERPNSVLVTVPVGHIQPTLSEQILDVAIAEREAD